MKKIIILMLVLVLCLSSLAACTENNGGNGSVSSSKPADDNNVPTLNPEQALKQATAYVKTKYQQELPKETPIDYTLVSSIPLNGTEYKIEWKVDNELVKVVPGDGNVTIDVDDETKVDIEYQLTAVVSAPDGTKGEPITFKLKVPAANFVSIPDALAAADGTFVTVKGQVTFIDTPWDEGFGNISVTISDTDGNTLYIYRLATKVELGDFVTIKGEMATHNDARQIAAGATAQVTGHENLELEYQQVTIPEALAAEDGTLVEVCGTVMTIDTPWSDDYNNISVTIVDAQGNELYIYRLSTKVEVGDVLKIQGKVGSYNGAKQIAQGATAEITGKEDIKVEYPEMTIPEALAAADNTLVTVKGTVISIDIPWTESYNNITVTIADAQGNELYIYRLTGNVELGDILTIKGKVTSYNDAKQIAQGATFEKTGHDSSVSVEYTEMTIPEVLAAEDGTAVKVSGTVTSIKTEWSEQYGNISVFIKDAANNELYIHRLSTNVKVGDVITIQGKVTTYEDSKQIAQGATATIDSSAGGEGGEGEGGGDETPATEMTIAEVKAAADGTQVIVSGTVQTIDTPWNEGYGNISVTIVDAEGNTLYLYRLATKVAVGDIIKVTGEKTTYNGGIQIAQGATAEITGKEDIKVEYPEMTFAEALAAADGTLLTVKGTVKTIDKPYDENYGNISVYIVDAQGNELYIYRLAGNVNVGDALTIQGKVGSYEGNKQIVNGALVTEGGEGGGEVVPPSEDPTEMTISEAIAAADGTKVIVTGTVSKINSDWNETYGNMNVTIIDAEGNELYIYRLATQVALADIITVTGEKTTYNGNVQIAQGATATIDGKGELPAPEYDAALSFASATNRKSLSAQEQVWEANGIKFINEKASSTNDVADYVGPVRCYKNSSITVEYAAGMKKVVLNVVQNKSTGADGLVGVEIEGAEIVIDGLTVTITFEESVTSFTVAALAAQIRFDSIEIYTA